MKSHLAPIYEEFSALLAWRDGLVLSMALDIYGKQDWSALPLLADALEDAGCTDQQLLNHLRDTSQKHRKSCWAVDDVLIAAKRMKMDHKDGESTE